MFLRLRCLLQPQPGPVTVRGGRTDLSVGHADEPLVDQLVSLGVPGLPLHDVALGRLISQGDGGDLMEGWQRISSLSRTRRNKHRAGICLCGVGTKAG